MLAAAGGGQGTRKKDGKQNEVESPCYLSSESMCVRKALGNPKDSAGLDADGPDGE